MTDPVMLDTDVVIDYLRNRPDAIAFIHSLSSAPMLSVVTVAELYRGVRDGRERDELDQLVADSVVIPLEWQSAVAGGLHERQYGRTHGVGFADALIAALAEERRATLVTLNKKHYPMLTDVLVPYRKP